MLVMGQSHPEARRYSLADSFLFDVVRITLVIITIMISLINCDGCICFMDSPLSCWALSGGGATRPALGDQKFLMVQDGAMNLKSSENSYFMMPRRFYKRGMNTEGALEFPSSAFLAKAFPILLKAVLLYRY
ncbi:hypothetical protein P152DRAFT_60074 [Eremomyces bilateralis CBS 781.70]|uniref:Uncharacterized protein n=1 Tax=Eremomyces bilateralis CBS 781.70 TaxID=1392243 RepID=A0A6G1G0Q3_9PEZI|nr:uncharacterized protein P152DRAFT_60074 [Eremomyces bilateralis CBS 781.70]KAF1811562.1 hypothetical protein P152DRAFT_60074 [Eremomyces bilateralis CBS 781.70]